MRVIARIRSDFGQKFGVPRQSGLVDELRALVVFEPEFANPDAVRGLEEFSHAWLVWVFSEVPEGVAQPTVRPPRLEGKRLGVAATRSPHRVNRIGLSSVTVEEILEDGSIVVGGADLVDGTPILDIKPYITTDAHPDASFGFQARHTDYHLDVDLPAELAARVPETSRSGLRGVLAEDPRPHYHDDPGRVYGLSYAGVDVKFRVEDGMVRVVDVISTPQPRP